MNQPLSKAERELMAKMGKRGGDARARLPKRVLTEIGLKGAQARWAKKPKRNGKAPQ